jgi:predicted nuclease of predicted toxin-antitoxin system
VKFLLDAQLPPALARWLQEAGHDAQPVREVGLREADDNAIWGYAQANGLVLLTKDEDFAMRVQQTQAGPVVVWLRVGNSSNRALRAWLEPRMPGIVQLATQGSRLVEVI